MRAQRFALARGAFVALAALPLLPAAALAFPALELVSRPFEAWFAFHCEREPARTVTGFAVCVRCYGVYFGLAAAALLLRPRITPFAQRVWLGVAALVMGLDVASEALGMRPAWAPLRFATGLFLGYPVSLGVLSLAPNHRVTNAAAGR
jgi:uncharacterized membrane protein